MKRFYPVFTVLLVLGGCVCASKSKVQQGVSGRVVRVSGNRMPSPDLPPAEPRGFKATVYFFEQTSLQQVQQVDHSPFYTAVNSRLVQAVDTKADGTFTVELAAGHYSVFIKKDSLWYANRFDDKNNIAPVKVDSGRLTQIEVMADYDATY